MSIMAQRDGWLLHVRKGRHVNTYWIEGLTATSRQWEAIARYRGALGLEAFGYSHDRLPLVEGMVRLAQPEAVRVQAGENPLAVLLPPLYARALTTQELMSA